MSGVMKKSRTTLVALIVVVLVSAVGAAASGVSDSAKSAAVASSDSWLKLVDEGDYGESWKSAAPIFQSAVSETDWDGKVGAVRGPLGSLKSRRLKSSHYATSLPGAPDGEYFVLQYDSSFANKRSAVETVSMMHTDKRWSVVGYFIR